MTLNECYTDRSYYFLRLEQEMARIVKGLGLNGSGPKAISAFCVTFGGLALGSTEDYKNILDEFQPFVAGIKWALGL